LSGLLLSLVPAAADNVAMKLPRFQFRLRTLFVAVTLIAAASWVAVDRQRLIGERDDALLRATKAEGEASKMLQSRELYKQTQRILVKQIKMLQIKMLEDKDDPQKQRDGTEE
jgi:hypothetical protein